MARMLHRTALLRLAAASLLTLPLAGCGVTTVVGAAAGAAISVTGAVVSTGVKAVGAGIDLVTPDRDDEKK
jgi:hypothetical protein